MTFNSSLFTSHLHQPERAKHLMWRETTKSTNALLIEQGWKAGSIAIAAQQTSGRGQWGRTWVSPPGGLYLSAAIAPQIPAQQSARLTLASAWGIATQLKKHHIPVGLKWPNDLYIRGKKLGGILTETSVQHHVIHRAIVGVGVNWNNPTVDYAISLQDIASTIEPPIQGLEHLAALVVNGIDLGAKTLRLHGLSEIISDYRQWLCQPLPHDIHLENL